jgi:hypothetical protein
MADRITLFISRAGADRAADEYRRNLAGNGALVVPSTLRDDDTGHMERGFRVVLINNAGRPVGSL